MELKSGGINMSLTVTNFNFTLFGRKVRADNSTEGNNRALASTADAEDKSDDEENDER